MDARLLDMRFVHDEYESREDGELWILLSSETDEIYGTASMIRDKSV